MKGKITVEEMPKNYDPQAAEPELFEDLATAYARAAHLSDASLGVEVDTELLTEPEMSLLAACEGLRVARAVPGYRLCMGVHQEQR